MRTALPVYAPPRKQDGTLGQWMSSHPVLVKLFTRGRITAARLQEVGFLHACAPPGHRTLSERCKGTGTTPAQSTFRLPARTRRTGLTGLHAQGAQDLFFCRFRDIFEPRLRATAFAATRLAGFYLPPSPTKCILPYTLGPLLTPSNIHTAEPRKNILSYTI